MIVCVAPNPFAKSSLLSRRSQAMIGLRPCESGALHNVECDAAAADDQHARAGRDASMANDRADPGGDAAPDDRSMGKGQVVADFDDLLGGADDFIRKGPDARHLVDRVAIELDPGGPVMHPPARRIVVPDAQHRLAPTAVAAAAAMRPERENYMVAGLDVINTGPALDDETRRLVP